MGAGAVNCYLFAAVRLPVSEPISVKSTVFHAREVWRRALIAIVCALAPTSFDLRAGELEDIGNAVHSGCDDRYVARDPYCYDDGDEETLCDRSIWDLLISAIFLGSSRINPGLEFTAYPYENDHAGYLAELANPEAATHPYSKRLWAEYGTDFDDIALVSTGLLIEGDHRFGFDLTWRTYFEDLGPDGHDDLSTGDANLLYRLWQSGATMLRLGLGANWLEFDGDFDAGYNFTMSSELFPVRPFIISLEGDAGRIGNA
jgi:hypothetical protein